MIITVTLNPALDKTIELDSLTKGKLNRVNKVIKDAGGKGINVAKTLKALETDCIATGFLGGNTGELINKELARLNIKRDFVWVDAETRTNTKIIENDNTVTEVNEQGEEIPQSKIHELLVKLDTYANEKAIFVLAGSVPRGMPKDIYANIIQIVHKKNATVILDCDGEALKKALIAKEKPDIIKPNHHELAALVNKPKLNSKEIATAVYEIMENGIKTVAVTMGSKGAMLFEGDNCVVSKAMKVEAKSTVGAGDAFVAGLSFAKEKNMNLEGTMKLCMAVSAGAVTTDGTKPPSRELIEKLMKFNLTD